MRADSSTGRRKRQVERKTYIFSPIAFSSTSRVKRAPSSSKLDFWDPKVTPFERFWALFGVPRDCLFPLPVEEKAISGLPRNAHDGLFPLSVEEKATSGLPREAQDCPFSDDSGHQLEPLAIAFSPCLSRKRLFQGSLGMLAMAFSLCLSRKRQFQAHPGGPRAALFG